MFKYIVKSQSTKQKNIRQFSVNRFLVNNRRIRITRSENLQISPLAKDLFKLPYIETVFIADNFVAIEINDKKDWNDVEFLLRKKIERHLNSDKPLLENNIGNIGKFAITAYIESTQNPVVNKFVINKKLVLQSIQFLSKAEAKISPLADELFNFDYVKHVFFDNNYIAITKTNTADWGVVNLEIRDFIRQYLQQNKPVLTEENPYKEGSVIPKKNDAPLNTISQSVIDLLNSNYNPEASNDGGSIKFHSYVESSKIVYVILEGALRYGPTSHLTLKKGLEEDLKTRFPKQIKEVKALFKS